MQLAAVRTPDKVSLMPEIIRIGPITLRFLKSKHETGGGLDMFEMSCQPVSHYHRDWD
jgi:hypothetical protein